MTKWAILGGGGSFGIHLAHFLLDHGQEVISIGRNPSKAAPFTIGIKDREGFRYGVAHLNVEQVLLFEFLDDEKPSIIVNFAAQGEGAASWRGSWRFFETNATAMTRMTEKLASRPWLERFIHIGTSELYGSTDYPATEECLIKPSSPYSASKAAFDLYLQSMFHVKHFPMNILRPSNAYGPAQALHRIIPKAIVFGLTGRKVPLQGGGRAYKSYIHSRDLAGAIWTVARHGKMGEVYNVGPEHGCAIRDVVVRCADALKMTLGDLCEIAEGRIGEDARYWLDSTKIRRLGWEPRIGWDEGIAGMVEWAQKYLPELRDAPTEYVVTP